MRLAGIAVVLATILCLTVNSAENKRNWQLARVLDSHSDLSSYVTGATTSSNSTAAASSTGITTTTALTPSVATSHTSSSASISGTSTSNTWIHRVTIQSNQLVLAGESYIYLIEDQRMQSGPLLKKAIANHGHGCRFVVGEDIKYAQEKGDLYVLDADGKECKVTILRQEKRQ